jgi:hypothetical protein
MNVADIEGTDGFKYHIFYINLLHVWQILITSIAFELKKKENL